MRDKRENNREYYRLKIDAAQAIGIDPRMEWLYENINYMEFKIHRGQGYDGACFSRHDRQYQRGAGLQQG